MQYRKTIMEEHLRKRIAAKVDDKYGFTVMLGIGKNTIDDVERYRFIKPVYKICHSAYGEYTTVFNWTSGGKLKSYRDYYGFKLLTMEWKNMWKRGRWNNFFEAVKIQRAFKRAMCNPEYQMCRRRLSCEFVNLSSTL